MLAIPGLFFMLTATSTVVSGWALTYSTLIVALSVISAAKALNGQSVTVIIRAIMNAKMRFISVLLLHQFTLTYPAIPLISIGSLFSPTIPPSSGQETVT